MSTRKPNPSRKPRTISAGFRCWLSAPSPTPVPSLRRFAGRGKESAMTFRLLGDENTSHRLVSACRGLISDFPIVHIADWQDGMWLGLDDSALLTGCAEADLVLVAFDRST